MRQVWLVWLGGDIIESSLEAQWSGRAWRPVETMPETRYVRGETRYINIQKPGSAWGG